MKDNSDKMNAEFDHVKNFFSLQNFSEHPRRVQVFSITAKCTKKTSNVRVFVFLGPSLPGPIKFVSTGFDFLPVCVIKCSCATLRVLYS